MLTCWTNNRVAGDLRRHDAQMTSLKSQLLTEFVETVKYSYIEREIFSAAENAKSWVAQRTTHGWLFGGPSQFWVIPQSIICSEHEIN